MTIASPEILGADKVSLSSTKRSRLQWFDLATTAAAIPLLLFPSRWTPLAAAALALVWILRLITEGQLTRRTPVDVPVAGLVLMAVVGTAVSARPDVSVNKLWGILLGVVIFYTIVNWATSEQRRRAVMLALVVAGIVVAAAALVGTNFPQTSKLVDPSGVVRNLPLLLRDVPGSGIPKFGDGGPESERLFNANEVGGAMAMLLPIPLALALFTPLKFYWRLLLAVPIFVMGGTLLLTQSLSALLGLGIGMLVVVWRRSGIVAFALTGSVITAGFAAIVLSPQLLEKLSQTAASRLEVWQTALAMLRDMPFTGIGLNTFPFVLDHFYAGFTTVGSVPHAHNLFLQTALDLGIPGLVMLVALLYGMLRMIRKADSRFSSTNRIVVASLAAGIVSYVVFGLTDAITLGAKPAAAWWALLGLANAYVLQAESSLAVIRSCDNNASELDTLTT